MRSLVRFGGMKEILHGVSRAGFLETVEKLGNLPPSERKIVTKETHQGCLSFAIIGFSELFEVLKNRTQLGKKLF